MKKILLLTVFFAGLSSISFAQSAGKGSSEKSGGFFHRLFHKEQSPHAQMRHFDKQKKDPKMRHNGTSYRKNSKSGYKVDGDGFSNSSQGKKRRRRK
ncbi:MAG: hypothetical protein K0Q95_2277 [Bacteroidota bacterium]|jgi:hypothetical protein|nr:hypothetical protein [Bacteroidota bacterium]